MQINYCIVLYRAFDLLKKFRFEFPDISSDEWNNMLQNLRENAFLPRISVLFVLFYLFYWFAFRKFNNFRIFWKRGKRLG